MYTKEELESMKFRQLKSIAKQNKISRRLTTKREIIDSLLNFEQGENLDDISLTLMNNSEVEDNSPSAMESEVKENLNSGKENEPAVVGRTRAVRRRFPKPRMTVFQIYDADDQSIVIHTSQSREGNSKYFDEPGRKMSKVDEDLNTFSEASRTSDTQSTKNSKSVTQLCDNYNEIQSSKKQKRTSTRNFTPRQCVNMVNSPSSSSVITRRTRKTNYVFNAQETNIFDDTESPYRRSHRTETSLFGKDIKMESVNDNETKESKSSKDKKEMFSHNRMEEQELPVNSNKKTRRRFPKPRMTINEMYETDDQSLAIHTNQSSKDADKECHENENSEPQIVNKAQINLAANNGKWQGKYFKNSSNDMIMKHSNSGEIVTEASTDAEDKNTELNETFEIEEECIDIDFPKVHKSGHKNKISPAKLRRSARKKTVMSSTKDAQDVRPQLNETFEIEEHNGMTSDVFKFEVSSSKKRKSVRQKVITSSPKDGDKLSLLKDAQEESPQLNETFEVEEQNTTSDIHKFEISSSKIRKSVRKQAIVSSPTSLPEENKEKKTINENKINFQMWKDNKNGEKRRSRSCQRESINKNDSNLHFFSPLPITKPKGTPVKNTRIPKFIKKMPNFENIHKKQFEKMESLVDNHQRKLERAKGLLTPGVTKDPVMVFSAKPIVKQSPVRKPVTQIPGLRIPNKLNFRYDAQNILKDHNAPSPAQRAKYNKQNVKEIISRKLPIHDKRENVRQESRTTIRGVRLNRRFELQMAHRNIN